MRLFVSILFLILLGAFGRSHASLFSKIQVFQCQSIVLDTNVSSSVEQDIFFEVPDTNSFEYFDFVLINLGIPLVAREFQSNRINKTLYPFLSLLINPFLLDLPPPITSML